MALELANIFIDITFQTIVSLGIFAGGVGTIILLYYRFQQKITMSFETPEKNGKTVIAKEVSQKEDIKEKEMKYLIVYGNQEMEGSDYAELSDMVMTMHVKKNEKEENGQKEAAPLVSPEVEPKQEKETAPESSGVSQNYIKNLDNFFNETKREKDENNANAIENNR